jgi:hypothetical protein
VILIVPEYFGAQPTSFEILALAEDLTKAMSISFFSGTIVFVGSSSFLHLAESIEQRLHQDARNINVAIETRFYLENDLLVGLLSVLKAGNKSLYKYTPTAMTRYPSKEELDILDMFPLLNAISAWRLLADEKMRSTLFLQSASLTQAIMEYIESKLILGCPMSALTCSNDIPTSPWRLVRPSSHETSSVQLFSSGQTAPKIWCEDSFHNINSPSPESSPAQAHRLLITDLPSPTMIMTASPSISPRSFIPSSGRMAKHGTWLEVEQKSGAQQRKSLNLDSTKKNHHKASTDVKAVVDHFSQVVESYRMHTKQACKKLIVDASHSLGHQGSSRKMGWSKQHLPDGWK